MHLGLHPGPFPALSSLLGNWKAGALVRAGPGSLVSTSPTPVLGQPSKYVPRANILAVVGQGSGQHVQHGFCHLFALEKGVLDIGIKTASFSIRPSFHKNRKRGGLLRQFLSLTHLEEAIIPFSYPPTEE